MMPFMPPVLKEAYECPPLFAWTLTPALAAQITAFEMSCWLFGRTITVGVYCNLVLYVAAYVFQSESVDHLIGTLLWPRQSARVREEVGLEDADEVFDEVLLAEDEALVELEELEVPEPEHCPNMD
jgi:hypothetical protein